VNNYLAITKIYEMKSLIQKIAGIFNYEIYRKNTHPTLPDDFESLHKLIFSRVANHTMTSPERIYSLIEAVHYIEKNKIEGAIVECGVWKGGSMMAVAETLKESKIFSRNLYLYDTFEGMPPPTRNDKTLSGETAETLLAVDKNKEKNTVWAYSTIETVKEGMKSTGYPGDKIIYVRGKVEETIPSTVPPGIALLRLDTDWYESTYHELIHLFPLLAPGGILILDDYGYWQGARKAVDDYFDSHPSRIFLSRIDETGRIAIKQ
jgi:O-methyltransferase